MKRAALALTLAGLLAMPALASAATPKLITDAYAKTLVQKKVSDQFGRYGKGWTVKLSKSASPTSKTFASKVNWGSGPHIQIVTPEPKGAVNMSKAKNSPQGLDRVTIFP